MIIVVEGVSAAGKSRWASRFGAATVDENAGPAPKSEDPAILSRYWSDRNSERWKRGLQLECVHEVVCFDTDPLKIHYSWCLWQIGEGSREAWVMNVKAARERITVRELGFADQIYFLNPSEEVIRQQKANDRTRERRNFETHLNLYDSLRRWYELLECLCPGKVIFNAHQINETMPTLPSPDRYNLQLFDDLVQAAGRTAG